MRCISVTWVVSGKMANRDAERGFMSPWISPPFRRNISATCSSRMPSASPWMKNIGAVVALSLSAPKSCPFETDGEDPLDELRKLVRRRAQLLVLGFDGRAFEGFRREFRECVERFLDPCRRGGTLDEMTTTFRTLSGWRIAHCIATPPPML